MGYYIRIFGITNPDIHIDSLIDQLDSDNLEANFSYDINETADKWTIINVSNSIGDNLIQIERNPVVDGELGKEELEEFRELIQDYRPKSAVRWLENYFNNVKVIYAFQLLNASFDDNNFPIIGSIKSVIWNYVGGIFQADNEGFSNDEGYHILWQFSNDVKGDWNMAVRTINENWISFKMDLGNQKQREEFWEGKVPKGATIL